MDSHQDYCLTTHDENISKMDKQNAEITYLMESHVPWPLSKHESILRLRTHQLRERSGPDEQGSSNSTESVHTSGLHSPSET